MPVLLLEPSFESDLAGIGFPLKVQLGWAGLPIIRQGKVTLDFHGWIIRRPKEQMAALLTI